MSSPSPLSRRSFNKSSALFIGGMLLNSCSSVFARSHALTLHMPEEGEAHERTWMAFVARESIWSRKQIPEVKWNLALIAKTVARYEPVSMLVDPRDVKEARVLLDEGRDSPFPIELVECAVDDLWLRDTGPAFVKNGTGVKVAIDFNFNGWGNKQTHTRDAGVAQFLAKQVGVSVQTTQLVLEGGCFEVDGKGTAILTKSCVLNRNRNPDLSRSEVETELKRLLGLRKIIWLEGIKGRDITDGHTDFYARFTKPGHVMVSRDNYKPSYDYEVTRENIEVLRESFDADGLPLKLTVLDAPDVFNEEFGSKDFAAGYIGYYVCNGAVIAQKFGDKKADELAFEKLAKAFPDRVIEQIAVDGIASGGGSIHCATQQEFRV